MNDEANDPSHRPKGRNWQRNRRRNKAQNNEKPQHGGQNSEKTKDMGEQTQKFGGRKQDKKEKRIKLVPVSTLCLEYSVTHWAAMAQGTIYPHPI